MGRPWKNMNGVLKAIDSWAMMGTVRALAEPGMNIALAAEEGEHPRAWRIMDITEGENEDGNWLFMHLRPLNRRGGTDGGDQDIHRGWTSDPWKIIEPWVYSLQEHYAVCAGCHHLMPCPEMARQARIEDELEEFERFNNPGEHPSCPQCQRSITKGEKQITFETNLYAFGPVTFHLEGMCRTAADYYDEQVNRETGQPRKLYCPNDLYFYNVRGNPQRYWCRDPRCGGYDLTHAVTHYIYELLRVPSNYHEVRHSAFQ
ncbi:hypothetical protein [Corynebacterium pacaense]|uniref:hypothetical protein n=1 Tax=Corynebacterium pacaense TaxID=1816684 RepID=UPI0009BBF8D0|nr:hypothetical protein [Corynebacterium pacaense]